MDNIPIEHVSSFNFLGLTIDQHLTWKPHLDKITAKITRATGILNKLKFLLPIDIKLSLYNTLVLPHFNYNLILWGHKFNKIEKLQKRIVRVTSCSKYNAHTEPIFKVLKILKLQDLYKQSLLNFYHKHQNDNLPYARHIILSIECKICMNMQQDVLINYNYQK